MDGDIDETGHVIFLGKFENNKRYKEQILQEIITAICAMLNSNDGKLVIHIDTHNNDIPVEGSPFSQMSLLIRILEQCMISIIGVPETISNINFKEGEKSIVISVKKAGYLITTSYNLFLPSQSQVVEIPPMERLEKVKNDIINRKVVPEPVQHGSHCKIFFKDKNGYFHDTKTLQRKHLKAGSSKRTTLADRMTGKGNKFSSYVSAFANHCGGHIYYGIKDDGVVAGEFIPNEKDKNEITKKVEKAINKMIWPEQISQPKRGVHWDIFFEPVLDEDPKPIPSTFVIVIYIAPCLGGVFTEEPECYEMVDGKVQKMSFVTWKKRLLHPIWLRSKDEIPPSVQRTTWSSDEARKAFTFESQKLRQFINNGNWDAISKECQILEKKSHLREMQLAVLSKNVTACYRRGHFNEASAFLYQYMTILPQARDTLIFEVIGLYLQAALKRASGDLKALKELLTAALLKAELIKPGLVTATVYVFAATVTDLINFVPTKKFSPDVLSIKALEHIQYVDDFPSVLASMEQKIHIILATFYLGCNVSGQLIKANVDASRIDKAKTSIMAVHEGNPLSGYREVQINLVLSIYNYRHSQQVSPDQRTRFLRSAFTYAKKAENLARDHQFMEMVEWSKANEALCTEELVRAKFAVVYTSPNSEVASACLPSNQQIMQISPSESVEKLRALLMDNIRPAVKPVESGSRHIDFVKGEFVSFSESKSTQFKMMKDEPAKKTTFADRLVGKGNKFACYVSAFANYAGGHMYIGINDDGKVEGESLNENEKQKVKKEIRKAINKMEWPKKSEPTDTNVDQRWDVYFQPVRDGKNNVIPSLYVVVVFVAQCRGGVFTEGPECYEIVDNKVQKVDFASWRKSIDPRLTEKGTHCTDAPPELVYEELTNLVNNNCNGDELNAASKTAQENYTVSDVKLTCLSTFVSFHLRRGEYDQAGKILKEYSETLPSSTNPTRAKVMEQYLHSIMERCKGDYEKSYEIAKKCLNDLKQLPSTYISAAFYVQIATLENILAMKTENRKEMLSLIRKAEKNCDIASSHLDQLPKHSAIKADYQENIYNNKALLYLGCSLSGDMLPDSEELINIEQAQQYLSLTQDIIIRLGYPLSKFRMIQYLFAQACLSYRLGNNDPSRQTEVLKHALDYSREAESLAENFRFPEMKTYAEKFIKFFESKQAK